MPDDDHEQDSMEAPPFLGTWANVYRAVIAYLMALLVLLYVVTQMFHY
jgi:hypothetical protein